MHTVKVFESKSYLSTAKLSEAEIALIKQKLTYTNKSTQYKYYTLKKGRNWYIKKKTLAGISEKKALKEYQQELYTLKKASKTSLVEETTSSLRIPTGLLKRLSKIIPVTIEDKRKEPSTFPLRVEESLPSLRPYQKEQLEKCLQEKQGTIESATGSGKTVVIQELIRKLGADTLVIVPNLSILHQTTARFEKYFGKGKVGQYGGGKKKIKKITLGCAPSIAKSSPDEWKNVNCLIADEGHHVPCDTIEKIYYQIVPNAYYRYGFTATPYRSDGADLAIEAAIFPVIHKYTLLDGINQKYLAKPQFVMFEVKKTNSPYTGNNLVRVYQKHVSRNRYLNDMVVKQVHSVLSVNQQPLLLVREKEHGHILASKIPGSVFLRTKETAADKKKFSKNGIPIADYVDPVEAVDDFNSGKVRCLIGTSIIGEGTDIIPVNALFFLTGGVSKGSILQNIGRGLRKSPTKQSVMIIDYLFDLRRSDGLEVAETLKKHSKQRLGYYQKIAPVTIK